MANISNDVMVSIICNTYNHEKYIEKAIQGFLMQDVPFRFEVLIHDDASTDNAQEIIKQYADRYPEIIKPVLQKENQRSKGVKINIIYQYPRARGKYLAFCEGDDFWTDKHKLAKQVLFLENNSDYTACVHKYDVVDEHGCIQAIKTFGYYEEEGSYSLDDLLTYELPSQLATLVCRNFFASTDKPYPVRFYDARTQGDIKLFLYLLTYGKVYRMSEVMSCYRFVQRVGGNSWTSKRLNKPTSYVDLRNILKLEAVYYEVYQKRISFRTRKRCYACGTLLDLKHYPTFQSLKNALIVLIKHPILICDGILVKVKHGTAGIMHKK